jgi:hypothetical protein
MVRDGTAGRLRIEETQMVTAMTNKLLATVMAVAVCGAVTAHTAQRVTVTVPSIATEAPHIAVLATATPAGPAASPVKPSPSNPAPVRPASVTTTPACPPASVAASIRQAYRRDYAALEQLKQLGSSLKGALRIQFTNVIASSEAAALSLQNTAVAAQAACRPVDQNGTIGQLDSLVSQARAAYDRSKKEAAATGDSGNGGSGD